MPFTSYIDNKLIDHLLGSATYSKPSGLYLALFIGDPATSGVEIDTSGSAYAREAATFDINGGTATNNADIEFAAATNVWGTITHCAIYDAATSGNMLVTSALTNTKTINTGDILIFPISTLSVTLT